MRSFRSFYERSLEWLVIALMTVLAIEVVIGVVFRSFGAALVWYDEVASILLAWLTFYGSALASAKRAHISCPELVAMMPPLPRTVVTIAVEVLVIGFFALIGWLGWQVLTLPWGYSSGCLLISHPVSVLKELWSRCWPATILKQY